MSGTVVVDDSRLIIETGVTVPPVVYQPPDMWKGNAACMACNLEEGTALDQLRGTASGGTWTNAWYHVDHPLLTASVDFEGIKECLKYLSQFADSSGNTGTSVEAYFIFFIRALDRVGSTGDPANLTFYVDDIEHSVRPIRPGDYAFNPNNFTPRMKLFEAFDLDPNSRHSLRIEWKHRGAPRPAVAIALDSIEFTPSNRSPEAISPPTASSGSPDIQMQPSDELPQERKTTKMVVAIVVPIVTLLVLGAAALLWLRRRRRLKMYEFALDHQVRPFRLTVDTRQEPPMAGTAQEGVLSSAAKSRPTVNTAVNPPSYLDSMSSTTAPSPSAGTSSAMSPIASTRRPMPFVKERR